MSHIVARYGLPSRIISDRGPQFESTLWTGMWEHLGSRVALAASKYLQTDGATERANCTLLEMMQKHLLRQREQWEVYLPMFEMAFNTVPNASTRYSPFIAMLGRMPVIPVAMLQSQDTRQGEQDTSEGHYCRNRAAHKRSMVSSASRARSPSRGFIEA